MERRIVVNPKLAGITKSAVGQLVTRTRWAMEADELVLPGMFIDFVCKRAYEEMTRKQLATRKSDEWRKQKGIKK